MSHADAVADAAQPVAAADRNPHGAKAAADGAAPDPAKATDALNRRAGDPQSADRANGSDKGGAGAQADPAARRADGPDPATAEVGTGDQSYRWIRDPKPDRSIIPAGRLDTSPLKMRKGADDLPDHEPSAPPASLFRNNGGGGNHSAPEKSAAGLKPDAPVDQKSHSVFPPEVVHRRESRTQKASDDSKGKRTDAGHGRSDSPTPSSGRNRTVEVPVDQAAEKQRVAKTTDNFIGLPHGKSTRADLREQVVRVLNSLREKNPGLALSNVRVHIEAVASRTGKEAKNEHLTDDRARNAKAVLESVLRDNAVQMRISDVTTSSTGETRASKAGVPDGYDRAEDRGLRITVTAGDVKTATPDRPAEKPKTDIPPEYQQGYTIDEPTARKRADAPDKWSAKVKDPGFWKDIARPDKAVRRLGEKAGQVLYETYKRLTDGIGRWNDQCARSTPDEALWKVRPPYPLGENKSFEPFVEAVKYKLKTAGYDPSDAMYRKYVIHWHRKGER